MDRGAWWAAIYGVAKSWTRLKRLSSSSSQYFCVGNPMDKRACWATVHGVAEESDMTWKLNNNHNYSLPPKCFAIICMLYMGEYGQEIYLLTCKLLHTDEMRNTVCHSESLDFELGTANRQNLGLYLLGSGGMSSKSIKVNEPVWRLKEKLANTTISVRLWFTQPFSHSCWSCTHEN